MQPTLSIWAPETERIVHLFPEQGIFLTGIEGSDPHVDGVRRNQLREAHDFYTHYYDRLGAIRSLGITWLRFGMPYSEVHVGPHTYDFTFMDKVVARCEEIGITIMADLLHFGLPDWLHASQSERYFQNPDFPEAFAAYARVFAKRYPKIQYYTLVNEPFVTAHFSAKLGLWNEHKHSSWHDDRAFLSAVGNIARAAILARREIEDVWQLDERQAPLLFVQNESFEAAHAAEGSGREAEATRFNLRRFAPLDLIFGHHDPVMEAYMLEQGVAKETYDWCMTHGRSDRTILGIDHYPTCIHTYLHDRTIDHTPSHAYQLGAITRDYWERYPLPLLHTEVNAWPDHAETLCQLTYEALAELRRDGYPVLGMGWYGDDLQIGWHVAMRGAEGYQENPVGLHMRGVPQPVAHCFRKLNEQGFPPIQRVVTAPLAAMVGHS